MSAKFTGLYKKEIKIFFNLPIAYAAIIVFIVLGGYFFSSMANYYSSMSIQSMNKYYKGAMELSLVGGLYRPYFQNLLVILLLMIPLMTMRLFSEEKREGTAELLFNYPVNDVTIILAKFSAAMTVFAAMIAGSVSSLIILRTITPIPGMPLLSAFLGLVLVGAAFIMLGIFVSALTESQIVAAVISFGLLLFFFMISWGAQSAGPIMSKILTNLSIVVHFDNFSKGIIDTGDIMYYVNFIVLFFFLTLRILETKPWRG